MHQESGKDGNKAAHRQVLAVQARQAQHAEGNGIVHQELGPMNQICILNILEEAVGNSGYYARYAKSITGSMLPGVMLPPWGIRARRIYESTNESAMLTLA